MPAASPPDPAAVKPAIPQSRADAYDREHVEVFQRSEIPEAALGKGTRMIGWITLAHTGRNVCRSSSPSDTLRIDSRS